MKDKSDSKSLLQRWKNREKPALNRVAAHVVKAPKNEAIPLSGAQQRLWFLEQLYPQNPVYNYSELEYFERSFNPDCLKRALQQVFDDNDVFKTSFELKDQEVIQLVTENASLKILEVDLSTYSASDCESKKEELLLEDARAPFDLGSPPLIRAMLIKLHESKWALFITMHHIITDKWSMGVFRDQLAHHYANLTATNTTTSIKLDIQYPDYAYWQKNKAIDQRQLDYWKKKLQGEIPVLKLPTDFTAPKLSLIHI